MGEQRREPERDDDAGGHDPVVTDDEVPPEARKADEEPHGLAPCCGSGTRLTAARNAWRRRSTRTSTSGGEQVEREDREQGCVAAGPGRPGALGAPEDAERGQHGADGELQRVLRDPGERRAHEDGRDEHDQQRQPGRTGGDRDTAAPAAEADDDEGDLEPLEEHALERQRERVPVEPGPLLVRLRAGPARSPPRRWPPRRGAPCSPLARRIAFRSHCRPKASRSPPTTSRNELIGIRVSAGPRMPTIAARTAAAAAAPTSGDRQPRVVPTASTIVTASTISTAQAMNAARNRIVMLKRSPRLVGNPRPAQAR